MLQRVLGPQAMVETWHGREAQRQALLDRQQALFDRESDLAAHFALEFWTSEVPSFTAGLGSSLSPCFTLQEALKLHAFICCWSESQRKHVMYPSGVLEAATASRLLMLSPVH